MDEKHTPYIMKIYKDYFMDGERVRFLFTSKSLQANEWACNNLRVNKTPARAFNPPAITKYRRITGQAHLQVFYMGSFSSRFSRLVSFRRASPFVDINAPDVSLKTLLQSKISKQLPFPHFRVNNPRYIISLKKGSTLL